MNTAMVADMALNLQHSLTLEVGFFQSQAIYYNVTRTVPMEIVGRMKNYI